ncbi:MAG: leucine-rich repeat domain-containing protein [Cytophagaceae bacterium]
MNKNFFHIIIVLMLTAGSTPAQVSLPDSNFRKFLSNYYPSVINPDKTLNVAAAAAVTGPFKCYDQKITDLSGIQYFTGISTLEVKYNPDLHTLPDISPLSNISILGLDSNGLNSLPNLSALVNLQILSFHHNQVTAMPGINSLTQLTQLHAYNNKLTTLPDLSALVNLQKLFCSDNPLTILPGFSGLSSLNFFLCQRTSIAAIPDLSNCTQLQYLICTDNQVTALPDLSNCPLLIELKVFSCRLSTFPDLSGFSNLTAMHAYNNELSFEDILPSSAHPSFASIASFNNQKPGLTNTQSVSNMSAAILNLNFDNAVSGNVYNWYKDGVYISTTNVNKLSFAAVTFADAGAYSCQISNSIPALTGITLTSKNITLQVSPCIVANSINYTLGNAPCTYPLLVNLDESSFTAGTSPFTYKVVSSKDTLGFTGNTFALPKEGTFDLIVRDATGCEVIFRSKLVVPRNEQCDAVFYPNGDGVADTYYIENTGHASIYNRTGELVKEFNVPGSWDGTDKKGQDAPTGLYVIVVNKDVKIKVTLLR